MSKRLDELSRERALLRAKAEGALLAYRLNGQSSKRAPAPYAGMVELKGFFDKQSNTKQKGGNN